MGKEFSKQEQRDYYVKVVNLTLQSMDILSELKKTFNGQKTAFEEMADLKNGRTNLIQEGEVDILQ